ncbi:MAG TPA: superoxide dismutase [Ni] [Victivallales bacterium]|nr:superoxide dismutase [Ni] [Victivallales bacterium]
MRKPAIATLIVIAVIFAVNSAYSHCQVPCGIYDDDLVFKEMILDTTTIKKSIKEIEKLSATKPINYNQIIRWTEEKSRSANSIINNASNYFLAQRIKTTDKNYIDELKLLHSIIVNAMKTKQSLDKLNIENLSKNIKDFESLYNSRQ